MKKLILILFVLPTTIIASEKEAECEMALNSNFYYKSYERILSEGESFYNDLVESLDGLGDQPLSHLLKKEREAYIKCENSSSSTGCDKEKEAFMKKHSKLKSFAQAGNIDPALCNWDDLASTIMDESDYLFEQLKKCKASDNHKLFIAEVFDVSKKHLKTKKEIEIELRDLYGFKNEHKLCSPTQYTAKLNFTKKDTAKKRCLKILSKVNTILKVKPKCSK